MKFIDLVQQRYSVRKYKSQPIETEKLEYVIEAARLAPSAVNFQPWVFVVITKDESKANIRKCYAREWFNSAPTYILVCGDHNTSWKRSFDGKDHCDIDASIAIEHMCLAATDQGLGTCWVCNFDPQLCRELFNIPAHLEPIAILPIGYPESDGLEPPTKKRKPLSDIIRMETF